MKRVKLVPHDSTDSRESIELDEYSDEEDEVFLNHSRNPGETTDRSARKPLMKKRRKHKNGDLQAAIRTSKPKYRKCCGPFCWLFLGFKTVIGAMIITVLLVNYFTHKDWYFWHWNFTRYNPAPCHDLEIVPVWSKNFPKMLSESSLRMINVSNDEVLDVVLGFGTGADGYNVPDILCDIYFGGEKPCMGGVIALDGKTGNTLWKYKSRHEIFSISCQGDLNNDNRTDCVAGGRAGVLFALNGVNGQLLWDFDPEHRLMTDLLSMYAAQFVHDLDGDHVPEILAVHGGDGLSDPAQENNMYGRLILFSGRTGKLLRWMPTPDRKESYYPPQILTWLDGEQLVLFGTGTENKGGSLYVISLFDLYKKNISKAYEIYRDDQKGMLTPAALVDLNKDNIDDIVLSTFNGTVLAFNGMDYKLLWNKTFESSETYSSVGVGHYNDDDIPDIIVKYQHGLGYPIYEYEQSMVLSGKDGSQLVNPMINSIGSESSPLTLSVAGKGNDVFLHWMSNCLGRDGEKLNYTFPEYYKLQDMSRADRCQQLFRVNQQSKYVAFQRFNNTRRSFYTIYDSALYEKFERGNVTKTSKFVDDFLKAHPELSADQYESDDNGDEYSVIPFMRKDYNGKLEDIRKELQSFYDDDYVGIDDDAGIGSDGLDDGVEEVQVEEAKLPLRVAKKPAGISGELVPNMAYSQPHMVTKYKPELDGVQDKFNYPYQYDRNQPTSSRNRYKRIKRQSKQTFWGVQSTSSTATLAPPLLKSDDSMDLIIASHWIYPSKTPLLRPDDMKCIEEKLSASVEDVEIDVYQEAVNKCLKAKNHLLPENETYETPSDRDAFVVNMGQMSIHRFTIRCKCMKDNLKFGQDCGRFLPYQNQRWPAFMGLHGDAKFNYGQFSSDEDQQVDKR